MELPIRFDSLFDELASRPLDKSYVDNILLDDEGACSIYRSRDRLLNRTVIVRCLKNEYLSNKNIASAFYYHANLWLSVPILPSVTTVFHVNQQYAYMEIEYRSGKSLYNWLNESNDYLSRIRVILAILDAGSSIHAANRYHGAMTPRSIIVTPDLQVVFTGIGAWRIWAEIGWENFEYATKYLPFSWIEQTKSDFNRGIEGYVADSVSICNICKEIWPTEKGFKSPKEIDERLKIFWDDHSQSPPIRATGFENNTINYLRKIISEDDFSKNEQKKWKSLVNKDRAVNVGEINSYVNDWSRRYSIDIISYNAVKLICFLGGILWILVWTDVFEEQKIWQMDATELILKLSGFLIGPILAIIAATGLWLLLKRHFIEQTKNIMNGYIEPMVIYCGITWNEFLHIFNRHFIKPNLVTYIVYRHEQSGTKNGVKYNLLRNTLTSIIKCQYERNNMSILAWNIIATVGILLSLLFLGASVNASGSERLIIALIWNLLVLFSGAIIINIFQRNANKKCDKVEIQVINDLNQALSHGVLNRAEIYLNMKFAFKDCWTRNRTLGNWPSKSSQLMKYYESLSVSQKDMDN